MLGTAGHVDHGKTALVKLLTGCETDTLAEEKQRGLTIDLGFAPCRLADDRIVGVVDVPGHADFIRNMVAGAHGVDVVIFVVAADDGIMPQTHEHLHILTLMGLRHGLVALTKIDLVESSRREEVIQDLRRLLTETFLQDAPICPLSNITGEGFEGFFDALNQVVAKCGERPCTGVFRLWVEDVFTIRGQGTVVTGIPSAGTVRAGDSLTLLPSSAHGHVRRLQVYGQDAMEGRAGECVALNLPELDHTLIRRGMVLCASDTLAPVTMVEAELRILSSVPNAIEDFLEAHLHVGTASVLAHVAMLEKTSLNAGEHQMIQLRLAEPLPLVEGERFVLRANLGAQGQSGLITVGGGRILGTGNVRLRRNRPWTLASLTARATAIDDPERWCELRLREAGRPLSAAELGAAWLLSPEELTAMVRNLQHKGRLRQTPSGAFVHAGTIEQTAETMLKAVEEFHKANPQRAGAGHDELVSVGDGNVEVGELALEYLLQTRQLDRQGTVFVRPGWRARVPDRDQGLAEQIATTFKSAGWAAPATGELAAKLGQPLERIDKVLNLLADRAVLVKLDQRTFIHRDALDSAKRVVVELFAKRPKFSTMDFRDALGVSRKYAVPLLDYLDKLRFTVRTGHDRTPGVEVRKALGH